MTIRYWRDAAGREVDFVIVRNRDEVDALECKWDLRHFEPSSLKTFRTYYPGGKNYLICPLPETGYLKRIAGVDVCICNPSGYTGIG